MYKILCTLAVLFLFFTTTTSYAEQALGVNEKVKPVAEKSVSDPIIVEQDPQVGKHVMANTDAGSMILSLLMVLALIGICTLVLKRFNLAQQNTEQLKVVASLSLGVKERLIVAQVGEQQLVLGVTPQQVTLIKSLEEPIKSTKPESPPALTNNILAYFKKN
jgi:flagellar protein FliO/FliZ